VDNNRDAMKKGRHKNPPSQPGEIHGNSKLSEAQVRDIFSCDENQDTVAKRYGITQQTVSDIRVGRAWRHLHLGKEVSHS
jgi:DNA-binding XRE family transcriptional regulator